MVEAFNTLPLAGGLFDQPAGYIFRMEQVLRATMDHPQKDENKRAAQERLEQRVEQMREDGSRGS